MDDLTRLIVEFVVGPLVALIPIPFLARAVRSRLPTSTVGCLWIWGVTGAVLAVAGVAATGAYWGYHTGVALDGRQNLVGWAGASKGAGLNALCCGLPWGVLGFALGGAAGMVASGPWSADGRVR